MILYDIISIKMKFGR